MTEKVLIGITAALIVFYGFLYVKENLLPNHSYQVISEVSKAIPTPFQTASSLAVGGAASKRPLSTETGFQYVVRITLQNKGIGPIEFDTIRGAFFASYDNILPFLINPTEGNLWLLQSWQIENWLFQTGEATRFLENKEMVVFIVVFQKQDRLVAGPFYTLLPPLENLPILEEEKLNLGYPLKFYPYGGPSVLPKMKFEGQLALTPHQLVRGFYCSIVEYQMNVCCMKGIKQERVRVKVKRRVKSGGEVIGL